MCGTRWRWRDGGRDGGTRKYRVCLRVPAYAVYAVGSEFLSTMFERLSHLFDYTLPDFQVRSFEPLSFLLRGWFTT